MGATLQIIIVICDVQYFTILEYTNNVFQEVYCIHNNQHEKWIIIFRFIPNRYEIYNHDHEFIASLTGIIYCCLWSKKFSVTRKSWFVFRALTIHFFIVVSWCHLSISYVTQNIGRSICVYSLNIMTDLLLFCIATEHAFEKR